MSIEVRAFCLKDIECVTAGIFEPGIEIHANLRRWATANANDGPAFTGVVDGKVIGCAGVRLLWPKVGEAWAYLSLDIGKHRLAVYRHMKTILQDIWRRRELSRVQATARVDFPQAIRLLEHLGFEREGILRKYAPDGTDCFMYAKVE